MIATQSDEQPCTALSAAVTDFESRFVVRHETQAARLAPTGEPYTVVVSGGDCADGEHRPILCATPEIAVRFWLRAAHDHAEGKTGTLYWRVRPVLESATVSQGADAPRTVYSVYSRLLISDRPELTAEQLGHAGS